MNFLKAYLGVGSASACVYTATYLATRTSGDIHVDSRQLLGKPLPGYLAWTGLYITVAWPVSIVRKLMMFDQHTDVFSMYPLNKFIVKPEYRYIPNGNYMNIITPDGIIIEGTHNRNMPFPSRRVELVDN